MNKRGDVAEKAVFYIISGALLTVIFFVLVYFISSYISISQQTPEGLEEKIFSERFVNSPYCFVFQDSDTARSYPGLIDWVKFTNSSLDYCYAPFTSAKKSPLELVSAPADAVSVNSRQTITYENLGFRLSLSLLDSSVKKTIQTSNWNGKVKKGFFRDVLVNYGGEIKKGKLFVEVSG